MSCFCTSKPYVSALDSYDNGAAADTLFLITSPIWAPPALLIWGAVYAYSKCVDIHQRMALQKITKTKLSHASNVGFSERYIYWKRGNTYYIVIVDEIPYTINQCVSVTQIIGDT